jgi:hypothetical protein
MADRRVRDPRDPYPATLDGVYEELDYWSTRQGEGVPTSIWEEGVKGRLEHLRDLERQFKEQGTTTPSRDMTIFISCGQFTEAERSLGRAVSKLVADLTPFEPYFADAQSSLGALTENILSKLHRCVGFIAVMHPRGEVTFPGGTKHVRASVWIEQEIGIAAFMTQVLKRQLYVAAYVHRSIKREGMREQLHLNPVPFEEDHEILDNLSILLPSWRTVEKDSSPIKLEISYREVRITQERHDYQLVVTMSNTGTKRIEKYELDLLFPNAFLEQATHYGLEDPSRRTKTHRFFRVTEGTKRQPLYPNSSSLALTVPYFVDRATYWDQEQTLDQAVRAIFYGDGQEPVTAEKKIRDLQVF